MKKDKRNIRRREQIHNKYKKATVDIFIKVLLVIGIIGLIFPLRPKMSDVEKRELTKFPKPTFETFMNGEFTSQISTWYADTFPFRETFMVADAKVKHLYGLNEEEIHGETVVADEIPEAGEVKASLEDEPEDGTLYVEPQKAGTIYVADNMGFELYGFSAQGATDYAAMLNNVAKKVGDDAVVYDIIAPTSIAVNLDEKIQKQIGSSNQREAFEYIEELLDDEVEWVPVLAVLKKHNSEYLYFKTDHHWTADGAYYAYQELMKKKGGKACKLSEYTKKEYEGFVGSFYSYSGQSETLLNNPDTVVTYTPQVNDMIYIDKSGNEQQGQVITDPTDYSEGNKYLCFIAGDESYSRIDNPNITDGSSCIIVKESYANAFVPFLVNSYGTVHVVDYRYYVGDLTEFVKENNIQDVIFLNNAHALTPKAVKKMNSIWG